MKSRTMRATAVSVDILAMIPELLDSSRHFALPSYPSIPPSFFSSIHSCVHSFIH